MSDTLSIAVSGLNSAVLRVSNASQNIVNASSTTSDGKKYQGTSVESSSNAQGGVSSQVVARTGNDGVDLASEVVDMKAASINYQVDAKIIKTVDDMQKKLLDTIA